MQLHKSNIDLYKNRVLDRSRIPCYTSSMARNAPQTPKGTRRIRLNRREIRSQLALKDKTVQEIADQLGMTRQAIYSAMAGGNTTLDTVSTIAAVLDVDPLTILIVIPSE